MGNTDDETSVKYILCRIHTVIQTTNSSKQTCLWLSYHITRRKLSWKYEPNQTDDQLNKLLNFNTLFIKPLISMFIKKSVVENVIFSEVIPFCITKAVIRHLLYFGCRFKYSSSVQLDKSWTPTLSFLSHRNFSFWAFLCMKTPSRFPVLADLSSMAFSPQPITWLDWR